ncbi:tat pathway signal sequence [Purpureocillium lavendulum]|uniref:Tat pathway signal sequence n=1 Tax=Purpureocillium lavendulum TaxID=1247861 RepID=A0AB34FXT8_9HYPO|nr:tat pathway signal sequence [Purpureocillium lavendulum]
MAVIHFLWRLINVQRSPLRTVPGPLLAKFTDLWYFWNVRQGSFEQTNLQLHSTYGNVVRYGPGRYSLKGPDAVKSIYGLGRPFPKSSWYSTWASPGQWSIFGDQDVHRHAKNRRCYQATYAMSALVHYEGFVDQCSDLFVQRLGEMAKSNIPIDLGHWFQCYAFDVIGMITYGTRLGFLDNGDDIGGVIAALESHLAYATLVGIYPGLHQYLFPLKNFWAGAKGAGRAYVLHFTKERIREAQTAPKAVSPRPEVGTEDFLTKFLAKQASDPGVFTPYHVLAGCTSNMVAGSDTTAISLSAVLYHLMKNPATLEKLRHEIDCCAVQGQLSKSPTFKESQDMPYLQAVIKESLRMHPATGLPLERVVPKGGATISDHFFPEGSIVGINTWVAHRDPSIFGEDANTFRPERWLIQDGEKLSSMNRQWMPFGLGSRTCIGRHVSVLEMSKLIPRIIRDFDFSLSSDLKSHEWLTRNFWFVKPINFTVHADTRDRGRE